MYILETQGPEFRVAHAQAIDNIYEEYFPETGTWSPSVNYVVETFKSSKVYTDLTEAWDAAAKIEDDMGSTEYGLALIKEFADYHFSDFEERYEKIGKAAE